MRPVILINPFEVPTDEDDGFVKRWREAAEYLQRQKGFVSTRMHQSLDSAANFRFFNVAEWESVEDFQRAVSQPEFEESSRNISTSKHPALYEVVLEIH